MRKLTSVALSVVLLAACSGSAFAEGDAAKGKEVFAKCAVCHQVGPGAKTLIGPELNGIVGRKAASIADYPMYSAGMKKLGESGFVWTEENIDKWIANPRGHAARLVDGLVRGTARGQRSGERPKQTLWVTARPALQRSFP
jgi:cytochrome c